MGIKYLIHIKTNGLALRTDLLRRLEDIESRTASQIYYGLTLNSVLVNDLLLRGRR
jgi:hypothetical protein